MAQKNVWFTSDLHIGHRKVAGIRGFWSEDVEDTAAHDAKLAENWDMQLVPQETIQRWLTTEYAQWKVEQGIYV